jgi:hypothetical protein
MFDDVSVRYSVCILQLGIELRISDQLRSLFFEIFYGVYVKFEKMYSSHGMESLYFLLYGNTGHVS